MIGAVVVAAALLGGLEQVYRRHGLKPHVPDSPGLIALVAREARAAGPDGVVIMGSSRGLRDMHARSLSAALDGQRVLQLSQDGISCLPVLDQLARRSTFSGTAMCTVEPTSLFGTDERDRERTGDRRFDIPSLTWAGLIDARAGVALRSRFAVLGQDLRKVGGALIGRDPWPTPSRDGAPMDRVSDLTFAGSDTAAQDARWASLYESGGGRETAPKELDETIRYLGDLARLIEARGGHVVFVELPSSGRTRAVEDRRYPRSRYWDRFVDGIGGRAFTVRDVSSLDVRCPDGAHLDAADAPAFTTALARELVRRGLLTR